MTQIWTPIQWPKFEHPSNGPFPGPSNAFWTVKYAQVSFKVLAGKKTPNQEITVWWDSVRALWRNKFICYDHDLNIQSSQIEVYVYSGP